MHVELSGGIRSVDGSLGSRCCQALMITLCNEACNRGYERLMVSGRVPAEDVKEGSLLGSETEIWD